MVLYVIFLNIKNNLTLAVNIGLLSKRDNNLFDIRDFDETYPNDPECSKKFWPC